MFSSLSELEAKLRANGYIADAVTTTTVFLAAAMRRPILIEGPAGSGKTQLAYAVAQAAHTRLIRLQCYEGIDEEKAIGKFDSELQRLFVELKSRIRVDWDVLQAELHSRNFLLPGRSCVP